MARHPDYWESRISLRQLTTELRTAHTRHDHVCDDKVYGSTDLFDLAERFGAFMSPENLVTLRLKGSGHYHANGVFVLDHENPAPRFSGLGRLRSADKLWR